MRFLSPILVAVLASVALYTSADNSDWGPYGEVCLADEPSVWDPSVFTTVPWFIIDLDKPAKQRWELVAQAYGDKMIAAVGVVKGMIEAVAGEGAWDVMALIMENSLDRVNEPYRDEIRAICELTGMPIGELTLMNLFYEVSKMCTSIVAQDANGNMIHGRNQDFGTFFFWNVQTRTWDLTTGLKNLVVNLQFVKNGKALFKGVTFAGHLGILTGLRPNAFTVTVNSRFGSAATNMIDFFFHGLSDSSFVVYAIRDMMTNCETYDQAVQFMSTTPIMTNAYLIMSGSKPGDGVVLTRSPTGTDNADNVDVSQTNKWYVLETNYDWNATELFLDVRRAPGNDCMRRTGRSRISRETMYQVLSSKPNLNKATVYTSVMEVNKGILQSQTRHCDDPCWFV